MSNLGRLSVSPEAEEARHVCPEMSLFRHIILTAVLDAVHGSCVSNERNTARAKAEALRWFVEAGEDYRFVCACADLEPASVRKNALSYIRRERENPSKSKRRPQLHSQARIELREAA
jgi:hypothetical protein